jgi:CDP-paratose 2-epimerase
MRILVTGGAGFVGSNLALMFQRDHRDAEVVVFDNLRRRGSELALPRLRAGGVAFQHGDVRNPEDLAEAGGFDLLLECSAEPSVHAGYGGAGGTAREAAGEADYLIHTNLLGTKNCLDAARRQRADFVFLSTSRVYPIDPLRGLPLARVGERLTIEPGRSGAGWSEEGITTDFPLTGHRSMYGATKLCSEHLIEEYAAAYDLRTIVDRCGVITGPWQMGKVDQGFVVLWASHFLFGQALRYTGFGGRGHQVRDLLHVADLYDLLRIQIADFERHRGSVHNVGGGRACSVSLAELSVLCGERVGVGVESTPVVMTSDPSTRPADIPWYVTDNAAVTAQTGWVPERGIEEILDDVFAWLRAHRETLEPILVPRGRTPA